MHATARKFALKYSLNLGRHANGYYYLGNMVSVYPTAASAIVMMRKYMARFSEYELGTNR